MESRVSNWEANFDEFKKSQDEFKISQAKFQAEVKTTNDLILLQSKLLAEKWGVESSAATPTHQPFIKSTFPLSLEKSNEIVLKLQSFHKEKVRAREKRDEFWSQFRPRYKPKTRPCLRPILKKFKKVRDYGKHHDDDDENVFDLFDKEAKDSVEIPPFLDSDCKTGTANDLVFGFPVSDCEFIGMEKKIATSKLLAKKDEDSLLCDVGLCSFPKVGYFPDMVLISVAKFGENDAHHVYVGRQQTTDIVSLKLGFHEFIRDKGGGLPKDKIWKDHSRISRYKIGTILIFSCTNESANATAYNKNGTVCLSEFDSMDLLAIWELGFTLNVENRNFSEEIDLLLVPADQTRIALQVFDERSHSAYCDFQLGYHMPISDTGGTLCRVFTSNVQIKDAHSSKFFVRNGEVMKNGTIVHLKLGFHELIRDKGGTISQRFFNSKSKNKDCVPGCDCSKVFKCEVSFDSSMIIDREDAGYLGLHHLEACLDKNRKNERKFTHSRFETGCCVVCYVVLDRDYCKGIQDKGGGKLDYGSKWFEKMRIQDVFSWTSIITTYVWTGQEDRAIKAFIRIQEAGVSPNEYTFAVVISRVTNLARVEWGEQLHAHVLHRGLISLLSVGNSIVTMYAKCGRLALGSKVFHEMSRRDIVSWSTLISGYSQGGHGEEAF